MTRNSRRRPPIGLGIVTAILVAILIPTIASNDGDGFLPDQPIGAPAPTAAAPSVEPEPGSDVAPGTDPVPSPTADPGSAADTTALALLATISVKGRAPKTGYDREGDFGTAWLDVDRNGCDTRNDILARDLTAIDRPSGCRVLSGSLVDPYTGTTIAFVRGNTTSTAVQIDHVVALMNAWETGAQQLSQEQRIAFANDPRNLLAVDGPTNNAKGAGDAATWLPPATGFRCSYVARQISVKAAYGLWVTQAEHDAMARVLGSCPGQLAEASAADPAAS